MLSLFRTTRLYFEAKLKYSAAIALKKRLAGQITPSKMADTVWRNIFLGKITFLYRNEGQEMAPAIPGQQEILLIRKLPFPDAESRLKMVVMHFGKVPFWRVPFRVDFKFRWQHEKVCVEDVVLVRSPLDSDRYLVRRVAALGGQELVSTGGKDKSFIIEKGQCWLLSDNKKLNAEEAMDSRTFGPIPVTAMMGRVIYRFQTAKDHGLVRNSESSSAADLAILKFELELDEMKSCSTTRMP